MFCYFRPKFGKVVSLNSSDFVDEIDKEKIQVVIVVHVYEDVSISIFNMILLLN